MRWLIWSLVGLAGLVLAGMLYQAIASWGDRRTMTRTGRFVRLGRREVYVQQMGNGRPVVVFESGLVASTLNWLHIQQAVSLHAQTFSYDRLGLGWSDACDRERTPSVLAEELHAVLAAAGVGPPYVLVAHSFGALVVRMFALRYAEEVAGMVLLDPMRTEGWLPGNAAGRAIMSGGSALMRRAVVPTRLGLTRIAAQSLLHPRGWSTWLMNTLLGKSGQRAAHRMTRELGKMPLEAQPAVVAQWSRPGFWAGSAAHIRAVPAGVAEMLGAAQVRGIPTLVLRPEGGPETLSEHAHCAGPAVREQVVTACGHWVHLDQPDAVVVAIERMLAAVEVEETVAAR